MRPFKYYGSGDGTNLEFGQIAVTIPMLHTVGNVELPSLWKLEINADPNKHFFLKLPMPVSLEEFRGKITMA